MSGVTATYSVSAAIRVGSSAMSSQANLGYGWDLSLATDLRSDMGVVDPFSVEGIGEALLRRLDCPRGALPGDPNYGLDVRGMLNRATDPRTISALGGQIKAECEKDDRVDSVTARVAASADYSTLTIDLVVVPVDPNLGGFSLTFEATDAELLIEELRAAS